jgi:hypothetical protein
MANECYLLEICGRQDQEFNMVTMHFAGTGLTADDTLASGASLIESWNIAVYDAWLACLPDSYNLQYLSARRVKPKGSAMSRYVYPDDTNTGTLGSVCVSNSVCPAVRLIPPMGFPSAGRVFMPSVGAAQIQGNVYAAGYAGAINALFGTMIVDFSSGGGITWQLAIYSRKTDSYANVTSFDQSAIIGFQRRRARPL